MDTTMSKNKFFNLAVTVGNMVREELEQERKWVNNKRCKAPNWGSIAHYLSDEKVGLGTEITAQEVEEVAHNFNWGV